MERSAIRGARNTATLIPDFASLHPGYGSENLASAYHPTPAQRRPNTGGLVFTADQPKK
jgi:hypothetical protein